MIQFFSLKSFSSILSLINHISFFLNLKFWRFDVASHFGGLIPSTVGLASSRSLREDWLLITSDLVLCCFFYFIGWISNWILIRFLFSGGKAFRRDVVVYCNLVTMLSLIAVSIVAVTPSFSLVGLLNNGLSTVPSLCFWCKVGIMSFCLSDCLQICWDLQSSRFKCEEDVHHLS